MMMMMGGGDDGKEKGQTELVTPAHACVCPHTNHRTPLAEPTKTRPKQSKHPPPLPLPSPPLLLLNKQPFTLLVPW